MKFKKPGKKDLKKVLSAFGGVELGRRVSEGVVGLNLVDNPTYAKAGVALLSLFAASAYRGPQKDIVCSALVGMAVQQGGEIIDEQLAGVITPTSNASKGEQFLYNMAGLNGACGCNMPNYQMPMLAMPAGAGFIQDTYFNEEAGQYEEAANALM